MAITLGFDRVLALPDDRFARGWQRECARTRCGNAIINGINDQDFPDEEINEWWSNVFFDLAMYVRRVPETCDPFYSKSGLTTPVNVVACSTLTLAQPPDALVRRTLTLFNLGRALRNLTSDDRTDWLFATEHGNAVDVVQHAFKQLPDRR